MVKKKLSAEVLAEARRQIASIGGKARAKSLTAKRREEIARVAGTKAWSKTRKSKRRKGQKKRLASKTRSADIPHAARVTAA